MSATHGTDPPSLPALRIEGRFPVKRLDLAIQPLFGFGDLRRPQTPAPEALASGLHYPLALASSLTRNFPPGGKKGAWRRRQPRALRVGSLGTRQQDRRPHLAKKAKVIVSSPEYYEKKVVPQPSVAAQK